MTAVLTAFSLAFGLGVIAAVTQKRVGLAASFAAIIPLMWWVAKSIAVS